MRPSDRIQELFAQSLALSAEGLTVPNSHQLAIRAIIAYLNEQHTESSAPPAPVPNTSSSGLGSPEDYEEILGPACSPEEADRRINLAKQALAKCFIGPWARIAELEEQLRSEQDAHINTLEQRDRAEAAADNLADAIATTQELGEHSNLNNPWQNAIEHLEGERQRNEEHVLALESEVAALAKSTCAALEQGARESCPWHGYTLKIVPGKPVALWSFIPGVPDAFVSWHPDIAAALRAIPVSGKVS